MSGGRIYFGNNWIGYMSSTVQICKSHLKAAGLCDQGAEQGLRACQGLPPKLPHQAGPHWGWESRVPFPRSSRVLFCGTGCDVWGQILFLFPRLSMWKAWEGVPQKLPVLASLKVPLLSLSRFRHILGVTFWIFLVKLLSQDPPLCLSALLDALPMVGYALGWVPWPQDVALIA